jgi:hypothetical protein
MLAIFATEPEMTKILEKPSSPSAPSLFSPFRGMAAANPRCAHTRDEARCPERGLALHDL